MHFALNVDQEYTESVIATKNQNNVIKSLIFEQLKIGTVILARLKVQKQSMTYAAICLVLWMVLIWRTTANPNKIELGVRKDSCPEMVACLISEMIRCVWSCSRLLFYISDTAYCFRRTQIDDNECHENSIHVSRLHCRHKRSNVTTRCVCIRKRSHTRGLSLHFSLLK